MTAVAFSPAARGDLDDIWDYTIRNWGEEQAERYVRAIAMMCAALADGTHPGRSIDGVRAGYRKQAIGSHVVFYRRAEAGGITVMRILHQRMDVVLGLRGS